jgi:hypothetical protein
MKEPFMNHMFPKCYNPPWERNYVARTEDATIYSHYEKHRSDDDRQYCEYCEYCDEELGYDENDELMNCDCEDAKDEQDYRGNHPKLSQITLQTILDKLPEGVKPSDVKISLHLDTGDMGIYGHEVTFSYKKTFEADPEGFAAAQKQYEENYQAYLVEREKYDEWKRQEQVKELEEKLAKLKK